jgi:hypothetical protein
VFDNADAPAVLARCAGPRLPVLGSADATGGDKVFRELVLARIIEPVKA